MGIEPYHFVSALNCVLAQRLVRLICANCRRQVHASRELLEESGLNPDKYEDYVFHEGAGCIECAGSGFKGRTAISELLELNDRMREVLLEIKSTAEIKRAAREEGMTFLRESAFAKVFSGETTLREINKVTFVE
jgi:type IV pilus assembly protein PilB